MLVSRKRRCRKTGPPVGPVTLPASQITIAHLAGVKRKLLKGVEGNQNVVNLSLNMEESRVFCVSR